MRKIPDPFMIDEENPEWTEEDFKNARPIEEVLPGFAAKMKTLRDQRLGRPPKENPKAHTSLRIDTDVLAWYKATGRGYQTRINDILRQHMERERVQ